MKTLILIICLNVSFQSFAIYSQICGISCFQDGKWSNYSFFEISFLTGKELNDSDHSYTFDIYSVYAYIELENEEYIFIKTSSYTRCGLETYKECIYNKPNNFEGTDQFGISWQVCTRQTCI